MVDNCAVARKIAIGIDRNKENEPHGRSDASLQQLLLYSYIFQLEKERPEPHSDALVLFRSQPSTFTARPGVDDSLPPLVF